MWKTIPLPSEENATRESGSGLFLTLGLSTSVKLRPLRPNIPPISGENVLRNQFSVMCVQKRDVSLWIIFQVWMHVPATCEECNFSSKNACYLKQYLLNPKLSHLIHFHFFSNRNKQSKRLKKYQLD